MTEVYEIICRIAPLVHRREDLIEAMSSCFSHFYEAGSITESIKATRGGSRIIYTCLGSVVDPMTNETLHLALKLGQNSPLEYALMNLGGQLRSIRLGTEIANFEVLLGSAESLPCIWGAVVSPKFNVAGLLIEDLSAGGINTVTPRSDIGDCEGDFLEVISPDGSKRTVLSDAKRYGGGSPQNATKYFMEPAVITLP